MEATAFAPAVTSGFVTGVGIATNKKALIQMRKFPNAAKTWIWRVLDACTFWKSSV